VLLPTYLLPFGANFRPSSTSFRKFNLLLSFSLFLKVFARDKRIVADISEDCEDMEETEDFREGSSRPELSESSIFLELKGRREELFENNYSYGYSSILSSSISMLSSF
jgi:hypothetical protein